MSKVTFKIVPYASNEYREAVALREQVLRLPFGQPFTKNELANEKTHIHFAGFLEGVMCATCVLVPEGNILKMQRVAVHPNHQNEGIGSALLLFCEQYAVANGCVEIYVHARNTAIPFYKKHDYIVHGDFFDEDDIPHLLMKKAIKSS